MICTDHKEQWEVNGKIETGNDVVAKSRRVQREKSMKGKKRNNS